MKRKLKKPTRPYPENFDLGDGSRPVRAEHIRTWRRLGVHVYDQRLKAEYDCLSLVRQCIAKIDLEHVESALNLAAITNSLGETYRNLQIDLDEPEPEDKTPQDLPEESKLVAVKTGTDNQ